MISIVKIFCAKNNLFFTHNFFMGVNTLEQCVKRTIKVCKGQMRRLANWKVACKEPCKLAKN
jgi:hypothetical protein